MISGYIKRSDPQNICIKIDCAQFNGLESDIDLLFIPLECINQSNIAKSKFETSILFKGDEEVLMLYLDLISLQNDTKSVNRLKFTILLNRFFEKIVIQSKMNQLEIEQKSELQKYIESNLHSTLKIQDLAKLIGINQQYLKIRFKNTFGIAVHEYIVNERLEKAMFMIRTSKYTLHEIALQIGYSSLSSFSQAFKKKFGKSPLSYKISNN